MMKDSPLFTLNWQDALRGLIVAVGTPILLAIERVIDAGKMDFSWKTLAMAGLGGGVVYLIKNFFTPAAATKTTTTTPDGTVTETKITTPEVTVKVPNNG